MTETNTSDEAGQGIDAPAQSRVIIRITLERDAYPSRTIVREFDDCARAADWFVSDSYFDQTYTRRATWEQVELRANYVIPAECQHW